MTRAVTAIAPEYDLTNAYFTITTIAQASGVEAQMNFAKERARFTAKTMGETFKTALAEAEFDAAAKDLVYNFSQTVDQNLLELKETLDGIIK